MIMVQKYFHDVSSLQGNYQCYQCFSYYGIFFPLLKSIYQTLSAVQLEESCLESRIRASHTNAINGSSHSGFSIVLQQ